MDDENGTKRHEIFECNICDYICSNKSKYDRHCLTVKHNRMTERTKNGTNCNDYICQCGMQYKYRQGLHKHKIKCSHESTQQSVIENPVIDINLIIKLIQQNENLQNLLIQQANETKEIMASHSHEKSELINKLVEREPVNNTTNNNNNNINTTNNNHQKFNLNLFLNETCKDAMNIQEFIDKIKITFHDLMAIGNEGFINGLSDIFLKELRELDITKRPIHCTDSKRETMYLKENDVWNKDDKENTKLKSIIEKIEYRNVAALQQWCNDNPDSKINNTSNNLLRDKIYLETLQGDGRTREKIIKNISKEVIIDKEWSL